MAGCTEKKEGKILSICKLVNACPPNKLPQIPPKAIGNQDMDCRSPAMQPCLMASVSSYIFLRKINEIVSLRE
jgi:hypothetical protein